MSGLCQPVLPAGQRRGIGLPYYYRHGQRRLRRGGPCVEHRAYGGRQVLLCGRDVGRRQKLLPVFPEGAGCVQNRPYGDDGREKLHLLDGVCREGVRDGLCAGQHSRGGDARQCDHEERRGQRQQHRGDVGDGGQRQDLYRVPQGGGRDGLEHHRQERQRHQLYGQERDGGYPLHLYGAGRGVRWQDHERGV